MTDKAGCCLKLLSVKWEKKATQMTDKFRRCLKGDELLPSKGGKNGARAHSRCTYIYICILSPYQFSFVYYVHLFKISSKKCSNLELHNV